MSGEGKTRRRLCEDGFRHGAEIVELAKLHDDELRDIAQVVDLRMPIGGIADHAGKKH